RVFHRVYHPAVPNVPFAERGSLLLAGPGPHPDASLVHSETLAADLLEFATTLQEVASHPEDALYQVALEHPGDKDPTQWHVSSVRACHLPHSVSESFTVHVGEDGSPFALDYFVGPIPHNGACPNERRASKTILNTLDLKPITNTTVVVTSPRLPPLAHLRAPPPLTTEGKPVEAVPEQSFLQKYWMYIAIA
ncbi:hypothetical protein K474DRAFT_1560101, partial [Panus rudis PR-1116 ss-1]